MPKPGGYLQFLKALHPMGKALLVSVTTTTAVYKTQLIHLLLTHKHTHTHTHTYSAVHHLLAGPESECGGAGGVSVGPAHTHNQHSAAYLGPPPSLVHGRFSHLHRLKGSHRLLLQQESAESIPVS